MFAQFFADECMRWLLDHVFRIARQMRQHFARVTVMDREAFKVAELDPGVDVVLLDWHQGEGDFPPARSYLGAWGELKTPAVLLGSAGLLHAVADELLGGFG